MPQPVSETETSAVRGSATLAANHDRAARLGELHGVRDEVREHLMDAPAIADGDDGLRRRLRRQRHLLRLRLRRRRLQHFVDECLQRDALGEDGEASGFEAREVEQIVHEAIHAHDVALERLELAARSSRRVRIGVVEPVRRGGAAEAEREQAERIAQIVRHHRQHPIARADRLVQRLVRAAVDDGGGGAVGDVADGGEVLGREAPPRGGATRA